MLDSILQSHQHSFEAFARQQSMVARDALLALPWTAEPQAHYVTMADESIVVQKAIEAADMLPFEDWREQVHGGGAAGLNSRSRGGPISLLLI